MREKIKKYIPFLIIILILGAYVALDLWKEKNQEVFNEGVVAGKNQKMNEIVNTIIRNGRYNFPMLDKNGKEEIYYLIIGKEKGQEENPEE